VGASSEALVPSCGTLTPSGAEAPAGAETTACPSSRAEGR
jgi:hypothetical protein